MENKKRRYHYKSYVNSKRTKQLSLEKGLVGFLCTCNFKEKECVKDAYKILEKFYDESIKTSNDENKKQTKKTDLLKKESNDISDQLKNEIDALHKGTEKSVVNKIFQHIDTGVKNVIFIKSTIPDPLKLTLTIIKTITETNTPISRFLLRFLPIQTICRANIDEIKSEANLLFEKHFVQTPVTFAIVFNRHYNNTIQRQAVIEALASIITSKNPGNKADLKNPDIAVVVEIIKNSCLLSIAPEYYKYKKYNLLELCNKKDLTTNENVE
ncbi:THUMP domain-containing protein 1 homolog [Chelonus insularis]|uniref:THUMP domain-containing protein 1 homolog n=1 Tax=Chelonus insularis TaxID=460826 RepID=UPI00158C09BB|nr:THUMP domain-containing protein 1 homolog [Chelonus insularis]